MFTACQAEEPQPIEVKGYALRHYDAPFVATLHFGRGRLSSTRPFLLSSVLIEPTKALCVLCAQKVHMFPGF